LYQAEPRPDFFCTLSQKRARRLASARERVKPRPHRHRILACARTGIHQDARPCAIACWCPRSSRPSRRGGRRIWWRCWAACIRSGLEETEIAKVMSLLPIELARDVFAYFDPDVQESIVLGSGRGRLTDLLGALSSDDRAEFIERLDPRVREQMLPLLTKTV